ncbi:MAG TPA: hypothetical protein VKU00_03775, partial [Chthonomonadaceae bacterium]|nr:hypothetical protein [Chthonomonadaceae bacterium]
MAERGIVLGFYQNKEVADEVLTELRRQRYYRSASIHHAEDGRITVERSGSLPALRLGADLIARYKPWVVRNETLVIVQAGLRTMRRVLTLLHHVASGAPATFILLPDPAVTLPPEEEFRHLPLVTLESLRVEANRMASAHHRATSRPGRPRALARHLLESETTLRYVHDALVTAVRIGQQVSMSAEWLLDNAYILQGHIDDLRRNLPTRFYGELPLIAEGPLAGLPRVYAIASKLIADTDTRLDRERILEFLKAYQSVTPLTMGELWALPLMLRLRMIECVRRLALQVERREREREEADFLANRLLTAARQDRERLLPLVSELTHEHPNPSPHLADQLVSYLYDEESALSALRGWLEYRLGAPLVTATQQEHLNQTTELAALANAITTLRQFAQFDWRDLFETLSGVEAILRSDPAGIYAHMDFSTRDQYRHVVEEMARSSGVAETEVASQARDLAATGTEELTQHVGYYLRDRGQGILEAQIGCHPRLSEQARRWARRHATGVYLGGVSLMTAVVVAALLVVAVRAGAGVVLGALLGLLALLPASELAIQAVNYLVTRLMPPQMLPRMSFEEGLPEDCRTLVIVPMMLLTPESIREEVEHLEIRYLANADPQLCYGLLSDFSDAPQKEMPDDIERLDVVVQGIEQLNARYGTRRFFLFHRERQWSESERRWIGWERKRGKLEQLNSFLIGESVPGQENLLRVGDADQLHGIRFVITLDADTQLPRDTARHLVETLAHPLNRPQLSPDGRAIERGYTIIQPSVITSLPSATATRFSRLFTDAVGIDPYTHVSSDVYQDLFGESSYQGKGIYDLVAFHSVLSARFPESHLLSHDLIEGA